MRGITVTLKGADKVIAGLERKQEDYKKALKKTVSDMKSRAPGKIASCVTEVYNIKKAEVNPSSTKQGKKAVTLRITGETIEALAFEYKGRLLTPTHFGMSPKAPPAGRGYKLTATIKKADGKKRIGTYLPTRTPGGPHSQQTSFILMGTGNARAEGTNFIPFQRQSPQRTDIKKMTTLSVPQMIGNEEQVQPAIQTALSDLLRSRLDYHMSKVK